MVTNVDSRICPDAPNYTVDTCGVVYDIVKNKRVYGYIEKKRNSKRKVELWRTRVQFTVIGENVM
jgi:hypothetical protein